MSSHGGIAADGFFDLARRPAVNVVGNRGVPLASILTSGPGHRRPFVFLPQLEADSQPRDQVVARLEDDPPSRETRYISNRAR